MAAGWSTAWGALGAVHVIDFGPIAIAIFIVERVAIIDRRACQR